MLNTSSVMIIFILLLVLTKLHLILLSALRIGTDNLLSTQFNLKVLHYSMLSIVNCMNLLFPAL